MSFQKHKKGLAQEIHTTLINEMTILHENWNSKCK